MKKKFISLLALMIFAPFLCLCQTVSMEDAHTAAFNYLKQHNSGLKNIQQLLLAEVNISENNDTLYYLFTSEPVGFIIISGDYSAYPIIGYSPTSPISIDNPPPSFEFWMDKRAEELAEIKATKSQVSEETQTLWQKLLKGAFDAGKQKLKAVEPLLVSTWDQGCYYNGDCPEDIAGPCGHAVVGCVATAMAQIMYYWRFPATGNGSYSYDHPVYGTLYANFGTTTYKWNEMTGSIYTPNPAIAQLLYHVGVSVEMDYSPSGSSAWPNPDAFVNYFKYSPDAMFIGKDYYYDDDEWELILRNNLNLKRPVVYVGFDGENPDGHAFICDGYDGNDMFHFDWGWSGYYNGYYYLYDLTPGTSDFSYNQAAVVNIYPTSNIYPQGCSGQQTLTSLKGSFNDGTGPHINYFSNTNCSWLIDPGVPVDYIRLSFIYFDTENSNDIVTVYNGPDASSPVLGTYSGTTVPSYIQGTQQQMFITFTSNGSIESKGWLAEYFASETKFCSGTTTLTNMSGTITDGSGAEYKYANNSNCRWIINTTGAYQFVMEFTEFDIEPVNDFVRIADITNNVEIGKYSGSTLPPVLTINTSQVFVHFISNNTITADGFSLNYNVLTSVDEHKKFNHSINVYPNPASQTVTISFNSLEDSEINISILDVTGRTCYSKNVNVSSGQQTTDIDITYLNQ